MKKKNYKGAALVAVSLLYVLSVVPGGLVYAEEIAEDPFNVEETVILSEVNYDENEAFGQYVDSVLYADFSNREISEIKKQEAYAGQESISPANTNKKLLYNGMNQYQKAIYDAVEEYAESIASGKADDTVFVISFDKSLAGNCSAKIPKNRFSCEEMNNSLKVEDAYTYFKSSIIDADRIYNALLYDCPQFFYWHSKTAGVTVSYKAAETDGELIVHGMTMKFSVAEEYGNGEGYKTDVEITGASSTAATKARAVVEENENKSDYEKLLAYKRYICNQVSYNYEALSSEQYGDPWQMIYVFDDNPATNVVCEGYAKAFKYLCDLSSFSSGDVVCALMGGYTLSGEGHMWNIVKMDDGKYYVVDVTACDNGSDGGINDLFLKGCKGKIESSSFANKCVSYYYKYMRQGTVRGYYCFSKLANYYDAGFMNLSLEDYVVNGTESQIEGYYISEKDEVATYNLCVSLDRRFMSNGNNYVSFKCNGVEQKIMLKDSFERTENDNAYYVFPISLNGIQKSEKIDVTLHYYLGEECVRSLGNNKGEIILYSFSVEDVLREYMDSKRYSRQVIRRAKELMSLLFKMD